MSQLKKNFLVSTPHSICFIRIEVGPSIQNSDQWAIREMAWRYTKVKKVDHKNHQLDIISPLEFSEQRP